MLFLSSPLPALPPPRIHVTHAFTANDAKSKVGLRKEARKALPSLQALNVPPSLKTRLPGDSLKRWATNEAPSADMHSHVPAFAYPAQSCHPGLHQVGGPPCTEQSVPCTKHEDVVTLTDTRAPGCWIQCSVKVYQSQSEQLLDASQIIASSLLPTGL